MNAETQTIELGSPPHSCICKNVERVGARIPFPTVPISDVDSYRVHRLGLHRLPHISLASEKFKPGQFLSEQR